MNGSCAKSCGCNQSKLAYWPNSPILCHQSMIFVDSKFWISSLTSNQRKLACFWLVFIAGGRKFLIQFSNLRWICFQNPTENFKLFQVLNATIIATAAVYESLHTEIHWPSICMCTRVNCNSLGSERCVCVQQRSMLVRLNPWSCNQTACELLTLLWALLLVRCLLMRKMAKIQECSSSTTTTAISNQLPPTTTTTPLEVSNFIEPCGLLFQKYWLLWYFDAVVVGDCGGNHFACGDPARNLEARGFHDIRDDC